MISSAEVPEVRALKRSLSTLYTSERRSRTNDKCPGDGAKLKARPINNLPLKLKRALDTARSKSGS